MPERFSYTGAQLNKLNPDAPTFAIKIESRDYADGSCSGETHWMNVTPDDMLEIGELLLKQEKRHHNEMGG